MLPSSMVTDCCGVGSDRVRSDASVSNVVTTKSYSASFTVYVCVCVYMYECMWRCIKDKIGRKGNKRKED
jgi:hypothetical protein